MLLSHGEFIFKGLCIEGSLEEVGISLVLLRCIIIVDKALLSWTYPNVLVSNLEEIDVDDRRETLHYGDVKRKCWTIHDTTR